MQVASLLVRVGGDTSDAEQKLGNLSQKLDGMSDRAASAGAGLSLALTAPLTAAGAAIYKFGAGFESAFAGVIKTVDATDAELAEIRQGILDMTNELPATANEIAAVGEAAGQLGIATEYILDFSRTMIDLGEATNLTSDEAATQLARFANIMQMPQDQFDRLGSTIVDLGNNFATTEAEIVEMAMRIAGVGAQIGMTEADVMAVAAAMSSLGINAEAGGTAISRVLIEMATAVGTGGDELKGFADVAGMTVDQFARLFEEDAAMALDAFVRGLGAVSEAGGDVFGILEDLGLSEIRVRDTLLRLSGGGEILAYALSLANEAWDENVALTNEAAARYATVESQVAILLNRLRQLVISFYDALRPAIVNVISVANQLIDSLIGVVDWITNLDPAILTAVASFGAVMAAAGPLLLAFSGITKALAILTGAFGWPILAVGALVAAFATDFMGIRGITEQVVSSVSAAFSRLSQNVSAVGQYFRFVVEDGDYLNDFLTHMPESWANVAEGAGRLVANFMNVREAVADAGLASTEALEAMQVFPGVLRRVGEIVVGLAHGWRYLVATLRGGSFKGIIEDMKMFSQLVGFDAATNLGRFATTLRSALNDQIRPVVERVREAWDTMIDGFSNLSFPDLQESFSGLVEQIGHLAVTLSGGLGAAIVIVSNLLGNTLAATLEALPNIAQIAVDQFGNVANTIVATVSGIVESVDAILQGDWARAWEGAKSAVESLITGVGESFVNFGAMVSEIAGVIETALVNTFADFGIDITPQIDAVKGALQSTWEWISGVLEPGLTRLKESFLGAFDGMGELGPTFDALLESLGPVIDALQELAVVAGAMVGGAIVVLASMVTNVLAAAFDELPGLVQVVVEHLTDTINLITGVVQGVATAVKQVMDGDFAGAFDTLKGLASSTVDYIRNTVSRMTSVLQSIARIVRNALTNTLEDLGVDVTGIVETVEGKVQAFKAWLDGLSTGEVFSGVAEKFSNAVEAIRNWTWPDFPELVRDVIDKITSWEGWPKLSFDADVIDVVTKIIGFTSWPVLAFGAGVAAIVDKITGFTAWPSLSFPQPVVDVIDKITGFVKWPEFPSAPSWVTGLLNIFGDRGGDNASAAPVEPPKPKFSLNPMDWFGGKEPEVDVSLKATSIDTTSLQAAFDNVNWTWPDYPAFEWPPTYPKFKWPAFDPWTWPDYPAWEWEEYPAWEWPSYPAWEWPALPVFKWPPYPTWEWPSIPAPNWLSRLYVPRPSWLDEMLKWDPPTVRVESSSGSGETGGIASVSSTSITGWDSDEGVVSAAWVGGPPPDDVGMEGDIYITINATINNDMDVEALAQRVVDRIRRRGGR